MVSKCQLLISWCLAVSIFIFSVIFVFCVSALIGCQFVNRSAVCLEIWDSILAPKWHKGTWLPYCAFWCHNTHISAFYFMSQCHRCFEKHVLHCDWIIRNRCVLLWQTMWVCHGSREGRQMRPRKLLTRAKRYVVHTCFSIWNIHWLYSYCKDISCLFWPAANFWLETEKWKENDSEHVTWFENLWVYLFKLLVRTLYSTEIFETAKSISLTVS